MYIGGENIKVCKWKRNCWLYRLVVVDEVMWNFVVKFVEDMWDYRYVGYGNDVKGLD